MTYPGGLCRVFSGLIAMERPGLRVLAPCRWLEVVRDTQDDTRACLSLLDGATFSFRTIGQYPCHPDDAMVAEGSQSGSKGYSFSLEFS